MQTALAQMSPQEKAVAQGFRDIQTDAKNAAGTIKPQTFTIVALALDSVRNIIKALTPLLLPMANAFQIIALRIKEVTASDEFQTFFAGIADAAGQITVALGGTILNIFHALAGVLRALVPYGVQFSQLLLQWSQRLGDAANTTQFSDAIAKFFGYVRENGPAVGQFLQLLVANLVGLGRSAAPLGPVILDIVNTLLKLTAVVLNSPAGPYVLGLLSIGLAAKSVIGPLKDVADTVRTVNNTARAIGGSADAMKALSKNGQQAVTVLRGVGNVGKSIISGLVSLAGTLYAGAAAAWAFIAPWLPWIALAVAIGAAIYLLYRNWDTVWNGIKTIFDAVVNFVIDHWKLLLLAFPVIGPILAFIAAYWRTVWNGIQAVFGAVVGAIVAAAQFLWSTLTSLFTTSLAIISAVWNAVWNAVKAVSDFIWGAIRAGITREINGIMAIVQFVVAVIQAVWNAGLNAMRAVASAVWGAISGIVSGAINSVMGAVSRVLAIAGVFANALGQALGAVTSGIGRIVGAFAGIAGSVLGAIGNLGSTLFSAGRNLVQGLIDGIESLIHTVASHLNPINGLKSVAHSILGINSPSKVFMEIGHSTMEGMALGIDSGVADMMNAMSRSMDTLSNTQPATPTLPLAATGAGVMVNFDFSGSTFGADSPEVLKAAVTSPEVISQITQAARSGLRPT
jgi:phage-related protein